MSDFKRKLAKELAESREYRESYAENFSNEFITLQMKLLRKQRGLSQAQLGGRIESNQGRVSVYENKEYGQWNVDTLRRIAASLDCWLNVTIESYGTLLDKADRFSAAGLSRPGFDDDPVIRRWLQDGESFGDDVFAPSRQMLTGWLKRDNADLQPLCDWLQGIGLPGFTEGEEEYQWILWSLPEDDSLRTNLALRLAALITEREIDVRPIGWRPDVLLRNLFMLIANLGQPATLQSPLEAVYQRESEHKSEFGQTRMGTETLGALRTAMERNQADVRWEGIWFEFVRQGKHAFLPGAVQAGFDGLIHLQPAKEESAYWTRLASAVRELQIQMYREQRVIPGKQPDVIDELKSHIGTIFDYWGQPFAATRLLKAALPLGWMAEAVSAWCCAVLDRSWDQTIQDWPNPLPKHVVVAILAQGLDYHRDWSDQAGNSDRASQIESARSRVNEESIRVAAVAR
ncbi:MAG: helix-turn-helix transcriptional regulator [Bryobacteraceae bacterium]|jgi:transcriptional regulator with XRE-family HTH domain